MGVRNTLHGEKEALQKMNGLSILWSITKNKQTYAMVNEQWMRI